MDAIADFASVFLAKTAQWLWWGSSWWANALSCGTIAQSVDQPDCMYTRAVCGQSLSQTIVHVMRLKEVILSNMIAWSPRAEIQDALGESLSPGTLQRANWPQTWENLFRKFTGHDWRSECLCSFHFRCASRSNQRSASIAFNPLETHIRGSHTAAALPWSWSW